MQQLDGRCRSLSQQLEQARSSEERHKQALRRLEEGVAHGEALRARQQAQEVHENTLNNLLSHTLTYFFFPNMFMHFFIKKTSSVIHIFQLAFMYFV